MKKMNVFFSLFFILIISISAGKSVYHSRFIENFNKPISKYFNTNLKLSGVDNRYSQGINSPSEKRTKIMSLKIDPEDLAGPGLGPEIISKKFTHFGTYSARLKVPDVTKIQPDVGAVVGYFTYFMDDVAGLSEIDFEWLIADPEIIYIGTWTGEKDKLLRIGRTINLAKGIIYATSYKVGNGKNQSLSGIQNQPEIIQSIENYNAASQFYTYGFDWYPDRIRWWIIHPTTSDTIVLWDYSSSTVGIPQNRSLYRANFWYTDSWSVETKPNSTERPLYLYELEIDKIAYFPYKRIKDK